jgi:hypothetical protein
MRFLILLVVCLPSCRLYDSLTENSEMVRAGMERVGTVVADVKEKYDDLKKAYEEGGESTAGKLAAIVGGISAMKGSFESYKAEADADGDGETSGEEWLLWLVGVGGPVVTAGGMKADALRRRNRDSEALKAALAVKIEEQGQAIAGLVAKNGG